MLVNYGYAGNEKLDGLCLPTLVVDEFPCFLHPLLFSVKQSRST